MNRRRTIRRVLLGCAVLSVLPCGFFGFWFAASAGSSSGSPTLAAEWRDYLSQFADPDAAEAGSDSILVHRFTNGEWVFGRSQNSHGIWYRGGGTVVVRDSKGQTRAFFGHVCGEGHFGFGKPDPDLANLAEFYKRMEEAGFVDHHFL